MKRVRLFSSGRMEDVENGVVIYPYKFNGERQITEVDGRKQVGPARFDITSDYYSGPVDVEFR